MQTESIEYEGADGTKRRLEGRGGRDRMEFDAETGCWRAIFDEMTRSTTVQVTHVPRNRVYTVRRVVPADEPQGGSPGFEHGVLEHEGHEGTETIHAASWKHEAIWYDAETDHWVVRRASVDDSETTHQEYVPATRVGLVELELRQGTEP